MVNTSCQKCADFFLHQQLPDQRFAERQNYLLPHRAINDAATMSMCPAVGQGGREAGETSRRATRSSLDSSSHLSILRCACKGQPQTLNNNLHLVIGMEGQEKK